MMGLKEVSTMTTEDKIILATISCIEKYGIDRTTIRQIGKEAGVNSAAISYYFRNKDALMKRVLDIALNNAFDMDNFKDSVGLPINERLTAVFEGMTVGALKYPNLTRAFLSETSADEDAPVVKKLHAFLDALRDEVLEARPEKNGAEVKRLLIQLSCATFLFPGAYQQFFKGYPEIDLTDEAARSVYIRELVNKLLL
jgi:AcrR family transcriptional regulator